MKEERNTQPSLTNGVAVYCAQHELMVSLVLDQGLNQSSFHGTLPFDRT